MGLTLTLFLTGCSQAPRLERIEGYAQGTSYHISFWSEDAVPVSKVEADFTTTLAQIDQELSTYRDDSYISQFNHSASTDWQAASADFIQLLDMAKEIHQKSAGCYDPTIGPLFDLWGFKQDTLTIPTAEQITATKAHLGMDKIEVDNAGLRIRKTVPELQLELSSMGEGYTIDKLSKVLESKGIHHYLVEFGGDMKIQGHKPNGEPWRVAIDRPVSGTDSPASYRIVTVHDEHAVTLNTSGTYRHYFDSNAKEYSHILNPRTGEPVSHDLVSVSVFGTEPSISDAWATTMLCLGPKEGAEVAEREKLDVFFIEKVQGELIHSSSQSFMDSKRVSFAK
jgi:thiamine biosynthesis lipoprotein